MSDERFLTEDELESEFALWAFSMPDWKMTLNRSRYVYEPAFQLSLTAKVRNTYRPDDDLTQLFVTHMNPVPWPMPREHVPHFIRQCVHRAMCHEADEWLRRDGVMVFDPHANGSGRG